MASEGIWIKYNLSKSDERVDLNKSLENANLDWNSFIKNINIEYSLSNIEVYVYYTKIDNKYIDPRILFKIQDNSIDLIKGRDTNGEIEINLRTELKNKIYELNNIDSVEKSKVINYLNTIKNYYIINKKIENNTDLDIDDIKKLYNSKKTNKLLFNIVQKFEEIKAKRNILEDYNKLNDLNDRVKFLNLNYKIFPRNSIDEKEVLLKTIINKPFILLFASCELRNNKEFIMECATINPTSFKYADISLRKNALYIRLLIRKDPSILEYTSNSIKSNKILLLSLIKQNRCYIKYINPDLYSDLGFMKSIVKINSSLVLYADKSLLFDPELALAYIWNTNKVNFIDENLRSNKKFMLEVIKMNASALLLVNKALLDLEFYKDCVKINPETVCFIEDDLRENDLLTEMAKANPYVIYYLYKDYYNNLGLLRNLIEVLKIHSNEDDEKIISYKKETSSLLKLELEKFD